MLLFAKLFLIQIFNEIERFKNNFFFFNKWFYLSCDIRKLIKFLICNIKTFICDIFENVIHIIVDIFV